MTIHDWLIICFLSAPTLTWVLVYGVGAYAIWSIPRLSDVANLSSLNELPSLNVIVAARDEEETIKDGVASLLNQNYHNFRIIVVDDRSSDRTGAILDELATNDPRLTVIHNQSLPSGWLGKVNALRLATEQADGEWLLFTDADVCFANNLLAKAVRHAEDEQCDHLVLIPELKTFSFWMEAVIRSFGLAFLLQTKAYLINHDLRGGAIGVGAFNLVRRSSFEKTEGFEWLRMEIGDDLALGTMLKRNGAKARVAFAIDGMRVVWHPTITSLCRALERIGHYPFLKMTVFCVLTWLFVVAPVATLALTNSLWTWLSAAAAVAAFLLYSIVWSIRFRLPFTPNLGMPIGNLILTIIIMNALIKARRKGVVTWRGTDYTLRELRENQRIYF